MATAADSLTLASQARRVFTEQLVKGLPRLVNDMVEAANVARDRTAGDTAVAQRRRDFALALKHDAGTWHQAMVGALRHALLYGVSISRTTAPAVSRDQLTLVDDATIEREILGSRLALAIMDRASWEFADLRTRIATLERREELEPNDMLRAHVVARLVVDAWSASQLALDGWRDLQTPLHAAVASLVESAYRQANTWLAEQGVTAQADLRSQVKRSQEAQEGADVGYHRSFTGSRFAGSGAGGLSDETRAMASAAVLARTAERAETVLNRLNRLVSQHLPGFAQTRPGVTVPASPPLRQAIVDAERTVRTRFDAASLGGRMAVSTNALLEPLQQQKQALKQAAQTPVERATIEIVALLFQSILTEERIPPALRVWFARLQMPVLRVAVTEPDFFAAVDHPARRLIDRMGACVMGFDGSVPAGGAALEQEIKRIVQVVEAYPDTGRRVFQTVLTEFEKFLEHYFKDANEASRLGVSLAQQVEQREEKAIQYTIELRNMLADVPVQDAVRQFLFQVWADVLAMSALKFGPNGEPTKAMRRAATDLIWSAGAKVTREERGEVIRRLPSLLKTLREGMALAGFSVQRQDERVAELNNALAAAFTAKAAAIPTDRLDALKERLESLEEMLPDTSHLQIDESLVLDLSPGRASCRWAAGSCLTTATARKPCSWRGAGCAASCRCSSRRRGAACCSSASRSRRSCRRGCCSRRKTKRSPCARRAARSPSSTSTRSDS